MVGMSLLDDYLSEIEAFLAARKMDPTTFGRLAVNDPKFVFDLRQGRAPNLRTLERTKAFMGASVSGTEAA